MDPKWIRLIAVVVVVGVVAAGIGGYYLLQHSSKSCGLASTDPIIIDQAEKVASADPAAAYSTPEWGFAQQIYQTLDSYNGTSYLNMTGVLAKSWSVSPDHFHWNFTLWNNIHFSNGDPVTAYTMWYSWMRVLVMQNANQYLLAENFWLPGLWYYQNATQNQVEYTQYTNDLNSFNFVNPSSTQLQVMEAPNQSFRVIDQYTIQVNPGFGYLDYYPFQISYTYLLQEVATPAFAAVDPAVVDANGGVSNTTNAYMSSNALGTGPYVLSNFNPVSGFLLSPTSNYWGTQLASQEPWNDNIQPAKHSLQLNYQEDAAINVQDLKTGKAAAASFSYLGPSAVAALIGTPCVVVTAQSLVYGSSAGSWWIYMNQSIPPFNNLSVREAVVHAVNVPQIITDAFNGFASQWVGPVPPPYPGYNPQNLSPYSYNLALAQQEMKNSPWPNGYPGVINYEYLTPGADWADMTTLIQADLKQIGININPVPVTLDTFYQQQTIDPSTGQCIAQEPVNGGPFPMGQDFYASDYISPDDWTQEDAWSAGSANICQSGYYNASVDSLVINATGEHNPANLTADYAAITSAMYSNYTNDWLVVPTLFAVYNQNLLGEVFNPMGSTLVSTYYYNTWYVS